ncbi:Beta-galactosidase [Armadillidium nasatum]|uniref:Beta-galactosidase n=1 Tax=Armadillidium nasatum TaxID=96803 RepID=A0A5N5TEB5_9CRUS|nr:Beta-galactosidase [Armadillidium nasatum]
MTCPSATYPEPSTTSGFIRNDWRDRLRKLRYAGFDTVETYIEWASHEPEPGVYNFEGGLDLLSFLTIANEEGLLAILRPGPYIDAERDMVENEYGSYYACDFYYTSHLKDLAKELLGEDVTLFTTDGSATSYLKCGKIADVYATIDFGPTSDPAQLFEAQRIFEPVGPLVNSEFYPGWLDHWGDPHSTRSSESVADTLDSMLALNASVNVYVFHGGTSFGLSAGSNTGSRFQACPTSYDYDAPLTEAGDPTEKYYAIRNVTQKYVSLPDGPVPGPSEKYAYGDVLLSSTGNVFGLLDGLDTVTDAYPQTFEALSASNGIVVYSTRIPYLLPDPARLSIENIHDRGYVYVDEDFVGIVSREQELYDLPFYGKINQTLTIVAESLGRVCYGSGINDFKGFAWINDFLLGRYWPVVGPQVTLFIPSGLLQYEDNTILILELEKSPCEESTSCKVSLVDVPEIDGPTPTW